MLKGEIIGNLGADAEVKDVNGTKFVAMRVAHTDKWTDENGQEHKTTLWVDVTMNNTESKVLPFLRAGVKVFVRGNLSPRLYSSPKEKKMVAGLKISATEVELCGGSVDDVPRQLVVPESGALLDVTKYYWCNADTSKLKKDETALVYDTKGRQFMVNKQGFVAPVPESSEAPAEEKKE